MSRHKVRHILLVATVFCVGFPIAILCVWCFAGRWPWPALFPTTFSTQALEALWCSGAFGVLGSSVMLSCGVAIFSVVIGIMTARGLVFYEFIGKRLLCFLTIMPLIVPSTVFAMGIHLVFVRVGLDDTLLGVFIAHLICSLPYSVYILLEVIRAQGGKLEEQARVLGAGKIGAFCVTLPGLIPAILSAGVMAYIISFSQYFLTLLLGGGHVRTYAVLMVPFLQGNDRALSCAYSLGFLFASLGVFFIFEFLVRHLYQQRTIR